MTILTTGKNISICCNEEDIEKGVKHYYVLKGTGIYDAHDNFRKVEGVKTRLSEEHVSEYVHLLKTANNVWEQKRMQIESKKTQNDFQENLSMMLAQILAEQSSAEIFKMTMPKVREKIIEEFGILPQVHEIKTPTHTHKITGITHEKFDTVLNLVSSDVPTFLTGAAGTGKNVICKQVAESLGLEFYFTNAVTQEYKLTGFIDANGHYHETQFYKAFKNGGLFFLDEMDGSIPEVLIMLNAAIANRYFDFPCEKVEAHKDFRIIAAGNTFGTGADMEYTGRYQLDAASLDRFALVEIGYSPRIEDAISNGNTELCEFIREFRKATTDVGIKHLVTYRSLERMNKLSEIMDVAEALKISLLKNMPKDDINIVKGGMKGISSSNKYFKALNSFC